MLTRIASPALTSLLRSSARLQQADLYTITLPSGTSFLWTSHDQAVSVDGLTWTTGIDIDRGDMNFIVGVEAQTMDMTITASETGTINGVPVLPFILNGGLDGARVTLHKAFRQELGQAAWVGRIEQFSGRVSDMESAGGGQISIKVLSELELFNLPLPPNVYQPQCRNTLYDVNCGVMRTSQTWSAVVGSASDALRLTFGHSMPQAAGWFDLGAVQFVTGANAGVRRTVRKHTTTQLTVMQPWPAAVAAGDAFQVYRGCDLTMATCRDRFNNLSNFRGHPFIPPPETIT